MDITYLGQSSFKIKTKLGTLVAKIGECSIENDKTLGVKKTITGPGEYEVSGISIMAYKNDESVVYVYEAEGLCIANLGDLDNVLSEDLIEKIGDVDILIINSVAKVTTDIISKIEPYFVIVPEENIFKDAGFVSENLPKFSIKKEDILESENTKVIVLEKK
jgi:L-ascorbate metabolism protein UlaG (beta-lactamase superfamily)